MTQQELIENLKQQVREQLGLFPQDERGVVWAEIQQYLESYEGDGDAEIHFLTTWLGRFIGEG